MVLPVDTSESSWLLVPMLQSSHSLDFFRLVIVELPQLLSLPEECKSVLHFRRISLTSPVSQLPTYLVSSLHMSLLQQLRLDTIPVFGPSLRCSVRQLYWFATCGIDLEARPSTEDQVRNRSSKILEVKGMWRVLQRDVSRARGFHLLNSSTPTNVVEVFRQVF